MVRVSVRDARPCLRQIRTFAALAVVQIYNAGLADEDAPAAPGQQDLSIPRVRSRPRQAKQGSYRAHGGSRRARADCRPPACSALPR